MRQFVLAIWAALFLTVPLARAGDWDRPIPQDAEWQNKRYAKALAWNRSTLAGAFDKVGKKDPRWDKSARKALEVAARFLSHQVDPRVKIEEVYTPAKRAVDAGCDDPLLLYLFARSSYKPNYPGAKELERRYSAAAAAMERSAYPPLRRIAAYKAAVKAKTLRKELTTQERDEAIRLLDAALALLPTSMREEERNYETENLQFELPMQVVEMLHKLNGDYQAAFEHVDAILAKTPALEVIRLQTQGDFLIHFAWDARGNGFADTVTEEGAKKFVERLVAAHKVLTACWTLKPGDYRTANLMLAIEKGIGGERADMEKWFERAMKACSVNKEACEQKLDWLDPKWHGSLEEMMAFGRACRDTKNWHSGITLLLADAHFRKNLHLVKAEPNKKYMHSEEVREDVQGVYEEYLKHYPDHNVERSRYAALCYVCGLYAESDKQFKILGDSFISFDYWPKEWMKKVRAFVANPVAREKPAK